jgi:hypothetical protein
MLFKVVKIVTYSAAAGIMASCIMDIIDRNKTLIKHLDETKKSIEIKQSVEKAINDYKKSK